MKNKRDALGLVLLNLVIGVVVGFSSARWAKEVAAEPRRTDRPYVESDTQSFDRCTSYDGGTPCYGRKIVVKNPLKTPVVVTIQCQEVLALRETATVPARRRIFFDLGTGNGSLVEGQCDILSWSAEVPE